MNVTVLADALAPVLRELVDATMAPVLARLEVADRRVAELEAALKEAGVVIDAIGAKILELPKVPTVEEIVALVPPAVAGKDADPEVVAGMVKHAIAVVMTPLQAAVDAAITDVRAVNEAATAEMKAACEQSIAELPKVPTAAEVAAFIPAAKDGKDVEPEAIRAMVANEIAALPKAKDGESVTVEQLRPMCEELIGRGFDSVRDALPLEVAAHVKAEVGALPPVPTAAEVAAEIPTPADGKDASPEAITAEVERQVAALPVPQDGKSVTIEEVRPLVDDAVLAAVSALPEAKVEPEAIAAEVDKVLATWVRPKDGASVTVDDLQPVVEKEVARQMLEIPTPKDGKDGVGLTGAIKDHEGGLVLTLTDGTMVKVGRVDGERGLDGLGFDDVTIVDDGLTFTIRFSKGDQSKEFTIAKPTLADMHKGIWHEGSYKRGSVVTWGGSLWLAKSDTEAKPETNDHWLLVTKRGRDGKDGVPVEPKEPTKVKLR